MDFFDNPSHIWLAVGAAIIIFEFFITPGVGLVFIGLGALTTGALLEFGIISSVLAQLLSLAAGSVLWAVCLWKPLKRLVKTKSTNNNQSHIIGTEAVVAKGGVNKISGTAKWSGTQMAAKLSPDAGIETLAEGALAEVVALEGSTLILTPKK
jgi:membrane protein implicated in regulation of membrane protease activity